MNESWFIPLKFCLCRAILSNKQLKLAEFYDVPQVCFMKSMEIPLFFYTNLLFEFLNKMLQILPVEFLLGFPLCVLYFVQSDLPLLLSPL